MKGTTYGGVGIAAFTNRFKSQRPNVFPPYLLLWVQFQFGNGSHSQFGCDCFSFAHQSTDTNFHPGVPPYTAYRKTPFISRNFSRFALKASYFKITSFPCRGGPPWNRRWWVTVVVQRKKDPRSFGEHPLWRRLQHRIRASKSGGKSCRFGIFRYSRKIFLLGLSQAGECKRDYMYTNRRTKALRLIIAGRFRLVWLIKFFLEA